MKTRSFRLMLTVALLSFGALAFASGPAGTADTTSDAQKAFDQMKTLAGVWQGPVKVEPPMQGMDDDKPMHVSLRVTSRGNAIVHEMRESETSGDPTSHDDPITMIYLENDRLVLTHYCDAGNRPRMAGKLSPDGKTIEFDFLDVSGSTQPGHMQHATFTIVDANHHSEDWIYLMPGDKLMHGHADLVRVK
jgi:hypothetical protein